MLGTKLDPNKSVWKERTKLQIILEEVKEDELCKFAIKHHYQEKKKKRKLLCND